MQVSDSRQIHNNSNSLPFSTVYICETYDVSPWCTTWLLQMLLCDTLYERLIFCKIVVLLYVLKKVVLLYKKYGTSQRLAFHNHTITLICVCAIPIKPVGKFKISYTKIYRESSFITKECVKKHFDSNNIIYTYELATYAVY